MDRNSHLVEYLESNGYLAWDDSNKIAVECVSHIDGTTKIVYLDPKFSAIREWVGK